MSSRTTANWALEVEEFQRLQAELKLRERILVWLDMTSGLRRGELAGLRWEDVRFQDLMIMAQRSVVDQVVGAVKTEASKRADSDRPLHRGGSARLVSD